MINISLFAEAIHNVGPQDFLVKHPAFDMALQLKRFNLCGHRGGVLLDGVDGSGFHVSSKILGLASPREGRDDSFPCESYCHFDGSIPIPVHFAWTAVKGDGRRGVHRA